LSSELGFDRPETAAVLEKRWAGFQSGYRKNLALVGPEGHGKTVFVRRFLERRGVADSHLLLFLEVRAGESLLEWSKRFVQTLGYALLRAKRVAHLPADPVELWTAVSRWAPRSAAQASAWFGDGVPLRGERCFSACWDLLGRVIQETGLRGLLVLDEFHRLENFPVSDPFSRLGRDIMVQSGVMFWLIASDSSAARRLLQEGLHLLFGQFELVEMGPLEAESVRKAIHSIPAGRRLDAWTEQLLVDLAQGHSACLDLLLREMERLELREGAGDFQGPFDGRQRIGALLSALFLDPAGPLRLAFEERLRQLPPLPDRAASILLLRGMAGSVHRLSDLAVQVQRPVRSVAALLEGLTRAGWVIKTGIFYRLSDHLFALWLGLALPVLEGIFQVDPVQGEIRFREGVEQWLKGLEQGGAEPPARRIETLLKAWRNERVEVGGRTTLLPALDGLRVVSGPLGRPAAAGVRSGRGKGRGWLVIPWSGVLTEESVCDLVGALQAADFREERVIVAGVVSVPWSGRLILQEAGVRIWSLQDLNTLFTLYGLSHLRFSDLVKVPVPSAWPTDLFDASDHPVSRHGGE